MELSPELALYYELIQGRNRQESQWRQIDANMTELVAAQQRRGPTGFLRRQFGESRQVRDMFISLTAFEQEQESLRVKSERRVKALYEAQPAAHLEHYVREELNRDPRHPVAAYVRLNEMFERRRLKALEVSAVLVSGLLGGLIGAILALLLKAPN